MGYSIGIRVRGRRLRSEMLGFMRKNYRSWPVLLTGRDGDCYASAPTDDLSYDTAKSALGVDYGVCSGWEREYAFAVVRWMALRVGTRRRSFSNGVRLGTPTPFMVYDGYETWPVIAGTAAESRRREAGLRQYCVDSLGVHNGPGATAGLVQHALFTSACQGVIEKAVAKIGPCPDRGDRHAWKRRLDAACLPFVKPEVDKNIGLIRDELRRLASLWDARSGRDT